MINSSLFVCRKPWHGSTNAYYWFFNFVTFRLLFNLIPFDTLISLPSSRPSFLRLLCPLGFISLFRSSTYLFIPSAHSQVCRSNSVRDILCPLEHQQFVRVIFAGVAILRSSVLSLFFFFVSLCYSTTMFAYSFHKILLRLHWKLKCYWQMAMVWSARCLLCIALLYSYGWNV